MTGRMPKTAREVRLDAERDERRIKREWLKSVERIKGKLSVEKLAVAISLGGLRNAEKLMPKKLILEEMEPVREAVNKASVVGIEIADREIEALNRGRKK